MPRRSRPPEPSGRRRGKPAQPPPSVEEISERLRGPGDPSRDGFVVRRSVKDAKSYVCPYCNGAIRAGEPHVVAYPDERLDERRHFHSGCWAKAKRTT